MSDDSVDKVLWSINICLKKFPGIFY